MTNRQFRGGCASLAALLLLGFHQLGLAHASSETQIRVYEWGGAGEWHAVSLEGVVSSGQNRAAPAKADSQAFAGQFDSDGDGLSNAEDDCPLTEGWCVGDLDGDILYDRDDRCPLIATRELKGDGGGLKNDTAACGLDYSQIAQVHWDSESDFRFSSLLRLVAPDGRTLVVSENPEEDVLRFRLFSASNVPLSPWRKIAEAYNIMSVFGAAHPDGGFAISWTELDESLDFESQQVKVAVVSAMGAAVATPAVVATNAHSGRIWPIANGRFGFSSLAAGKRTTGDLTEHFPVGPVSIGAIDSHGSVNEPATALLGDSDCYFPFANFLHLADEEIATLACSDESFSDRHLSVHRITSDLGSVTQSDVLDAPGDPSAFAVSFTRRSAGGWHLLWRQNSSQSGGTEPDEPARYFHSVWSEDAGALSAPVEVLRERPDVPVASIAEGLNGMFYPVTRNVLPDGRPELRIGKQFGGEIAMGEQLVAVGAVPDSLLYAIVSADRFDNVHTKSWTYEGVDSGNEIRHVAALKRHYSGDSGEFNITVTAPAQQEVYYAGEEAQISMSFIAADHQTAPTELLQVKIDFDGAFVIENGFMDDTWACYLDKDGIRCRLIHALAPGETVSLTVPVRVANNPGEHSIAVFAYALKDTAHRHEFAQVQVLENRPDADGDGINDDTDNCPQIANTDQADRDNDGIGDVCDPQDDTDTDGDGIRDDADNCPLTANADQADQDGDGLGDACEDDTDGDGLADASDDCPTEPDNACVAGLQVEASLTASAVDGQAPLYVQFDASESRFSDGRSLKGARYTMVYGDGTRAVQADDPIFNKVYEAAGQFDAQVIVVAGNGEYDESSPIRIAPEVEVDVSSRGGPRNERALERNQGAQGYSRSGGKGGKEPGSKSASEEPVQPRYEYPFELKSGQRDATSVSVTVTLDNAEDVVGLILSGPGMASPIEIEGVSPLELVIPNPEDGVYQVEVLEVETQAGTLITTVADVVLEYRAVQETVAQLLVSKRQGVAPVQVIFDGSRSIAQEGTTLVEYAFDFDGDGVADRVGTDSVAAHTYTRAGTYTPSLTVRDSDDAVSVSKAAVAVGDDTVPPAPSSPQEAARSGGGALGWLLLPLLMPACLRRRRLG